MSTPRNSAPRGQEVPEAWCLVLPVKRLGSAKSRLRDRVGDLSSDLALAFAADTVAAALACTRVARVVVVTDDATAADGLSALGADIVPDGPDAGLNPALRYGASAAAAAGLGVGALAADLPSLRPTQLALALARAAEAPAAFVRDRAGTGTTLLVARTLDAFRPAFGRDSARAHLLGGAVEVAARGLDTVREDVDTPADLDRATRRGVGPRTARVLTRLPATTAAPPGR